MGALVESYRTARFPRQRVVACVGEIDEAGRLGVRQQAEQGDAPWQGGRGDEPRKVFQELSLVALVEVALPARTGVTIRKRCAGRPTGHQATLLQRLGLLLPAALNSAAVWCGLA